MPNPPVKYCLVTVPVFCDDLDFRSLRLFLRSIRTFIDDFRSTFFTRVSSSLRNPIIMFVPGFTPTDSSISILLAAPVLNLHTVSATHNFTFRTPQNLTLGQRSQRLPFSDSLWF